MENGAVVYSDLNLGAGCVARYVCNEGYTLQSIRGQKEFVCDDYGIWNGDTSTAPVECLCKFNALITTYCFCVECLCEFNALTSTCNYSFHAVNFPAIKWSCDS